MAQIAEAVFSQGPFEPTADMQAPDGQRTRTCQATHSRHHAGSTPEGIERVNLVPRGLLPSRDDLHDQPNPRPQTLALDLVSIVAQAAARRRQLEEVSERTPHAHSMQVRLFTATLTLGFLTIGSARASAGQTCDEGNAAACTELARITPDSAYSASLFSRACEGGDSAGCYGAGFMFYGGRGVARDWAKAIVAFEKACEGGDSAGCYGAATMRERGEGGPRDPVRALTLLTKGCDAGSMESCHRLGFIYAAGEGTPKDVTKAARLFAKACEARDAIACSNLGTMYFNGEGVMKNSARAVELFRVGCDGNDAVGCNGLAVVYQSGRGVRRDPRKAAGLFLRACELGGSQTACTNLGELYLNGQGVAKNLSQAVKFFQRGCDAGDWPGCGLLGAMYESGKGTLKDHLKALSLYRNVCERGVEQACEALRTRYEAMASDAYLHQQMCDEGLDTHCRERGVIHYLGGQRPEASSAASYELECRAGNALSCHDLAVLYQKGDGVSRQPFYAVEFLRKACDYGLPEGCEHMETAQALLAVGYAAELEEACRYRLAGSCYNIGVMYLNGYGVARDKERAVRAFQTACDDGDADGCRALEMAKALPAQAVSGGAVKGAQ